MSAFDKIIGYSAEKKELKQIADILAQPAVYGALGVSAPRGLLLYGEPGVGKTLMANALIEASGRPAVVCRKDKPDGDFIKDIKDKFMQAVDCAPSIVFLDDMDKFTNGDEQHRDAEEYVTVQACIDEVRGKDVFVLATANNVRVLPHSLQRAGRFDRRIKVSAPHGADAIRIVTHYLQGKEIMGDVDTEYIGKLMDGHSCADLETVINEAGLLAGYERASAISLRHFIEAYIKQTYGTAALPDGGDEDEALASFEELRESLRDKENHVGRVACHEIGHAVIAEALDPGSVTLVTLHKSADGYRGFTAVYNSAPGDALRNKRRQVMIALGGMAAVEQKYGTADIGNQSDLETAFDIVNTLVTVSCAYGFVHRDGAYRNSETAIVAAEQVAAAEIERYHRRDKEILAENHELFDKLIAALLEKKTLTAADIAEIKKTCTLTTFAA